MADGGYNILVFNRSDRSTVRGLVDPSLVAWELGHLTQRTDWKSRQLQVWLSAYEEGWQISTSGGRHAIRRGRRRAGLFGLFGVVNVPEFRRWLAQNFSRMDSPDPAPDTVTVQER